MLSPKTLKYLRLTHRYVSFICAGILFVYLLSGFLLNHRKEFTFMNQKKIVQENLLKDFEMICNK